MNGNGGLGAEVCIMAGSLLTRSTYMIVHSVSSNFLYVTCSSWFEIYKGYYNNDGIDLQKVNFTHAHTPPPAPSHPLTHTAMAQAVLCAVVHKADGILLLVPQEAARLPQDYRP